MEKLRNNNSLIHEQSNLNLHTVMHGAQLITGVELPGGRVKRQSNREPIRIVTFNDSSVTTK